MHTCKELSRDSHTVANRLYRFFAGNYNRWFDVQEVFAFADVFCPCFATRVSEINQLLARAGSRRRIVCDRVPEDKRLFRYRLTTVKEPPNA